MLTIYTDGACSGNPGPGGWAYKVIRQDGTSYLHGGHLPHTSSNRAEVTAVLEALNNQELIDADSVTICTDSQYVLFGIARLLSNKKRLPTHVDIWEAIAALLPKFKHIAWVKVKGHSGDVHNTECDKLAVYHSKLKPS